MNSGWMIVVACYGYPCHRPLEVVEWLCPSGPYPVPVTGRCQVAKSTAATRLRRVFAQQLQDLTSEGYRPRLDPGDGGRSTLHFKVEGEEHELRCSEDDVASFSSVTATCSRGCRRTN